MNQIIQQNQVRTHHMKYDVYSKGLGKVDNLYFSAINTNTHSNGGENKEQKKSNYWKFSSSRIHFGIAGYNMIKSHSRTESLYYVLTFYTIFILGIIEDIYFENQIIKVNKNARF